MKKISYIFSLLAMMLLFVASCSEEDNLDVDLSTYNSDTYVPTEVDAWIAENLTDPYNIEVVYRFERNLTDVSRDISPVNYEMVQPTMQMVLDGFLKVYENVGGTTFIKTLSPKQFVLYGSVSYNSNGSVTLGTADGGRRVVLYDLNNLNVADGENIRRRLRTIHHEFTHIVNQNVAIPANFEQVSPGDYFADWTNSSNTAAVAKELGFVSQYARSSFGEDFAEMTAHLLVEGQIWFDNYVLTTNADASAKLREKESIVRDYFKTYFDIDFSELQAEVQNVLRNNYNASDPEDLTQTLAAYLNGDQVSYIRYEPSAAHYTTYGNSAAFGTVYDNMVAGVRANMAASLNWPNSVVSYVEFRFTDSENMVFRIAFKQTAAATTTYFADYYFTMAINSGTGVIQFTKSMVSGSHYNGNAAYLVGGFEQYILPYLTNRNFVAAWLPSTIPPTSPLYRTFGGFYVEGSAANYVYGPIVLK